MLPRFAVQFKLNSRLLTQLSDEVKQHKACSKKVATVPGSLNVVSLLIPLEPHADAIFEEGADETQTCQVGQVLFGYPQELENTKGKSNVIFNYYLRFW